MTLGADKAYDVTTSSRACETATSRRTLPLMGTAPRQGAIARPRSTAGRRVTGLCCLTARPQRIEEAFAG